MLVNSPRQAVRPKDKGKYIDFAISGAGQRYNTSVNPKTTDTGSFKHQIRHFTDLQSNRQTNNDLFIYHDIGGNDLLQIVYAISFGNFTNNELTKYIDKEINEYIKATIENLKTLYNYGMRNLIIIIGNDLVKDVPMYIKFAKKLTYPNDPLNFIQIHILDKMVSLLVQELDKFNINNKELKSDILFTKDYMDIIRTEYNNTIIDPITNTYNTLAGFGYPHKPNWPITEQKPTNSPQNIIYIDDIHYTEHTNQLIATLLLNYIKKR